MINYRILVFLIFTTPALAQAAACCGGGFALPSLITGDDRGQATTSIVSSSTTIDVQPGGKWLHRANPEQSETIKINGARIISDLWQVGASVPIVRRSRLGPDGDSSASGFGDLALTLGYEAMPDWDYSDWHPKGITFLQMVMPTGRSRLESSNDLNLDVTGRGLYSIGPGIVLLKIRPPFDIQFLAEIHRSLPRDVESPQAGGSIHIEPGTGATTSISAGWSKDNLHFGLGALLSYEDKMSVRGSASSVAISDIALERYATVSASIAYLLDIDWAMSATYSDQALIGSPSNTTLSRSVMIALQRRWQR